MSLLVSFGEQCHRHDQHRGEHCDADAALSNAGTTEHNGERGAD
jgi:hypothetical protein